MITQRPLLDRVVTRALGRYDLPRLATLVALILCVTYWPAAFYDYAIDKGDCRIWHTKPQDDGSIERTCIRYRKPGQP
jgi:hypothetical protein